jgi:hypothetical protein
MRRHDTTQITFRVPNDLLARTEEVAELQAASSSGYKPDRTEVLRGAVARGLEVMKQELEIVAEAKQKKTKTKKH